MKPAAPLLILLLALALPALAEDGTLDAGGVRIHYYVRGRGEPVVLIHGYTASAALNWELPGVAGELAKRYRVIMLDVRGHGRSDRPTSVSDYGLNMVDDVVRLMDRLGVKRAPVVGYSMGGMIALKLASLHPERVDAVVLGGMGWLRPGVAVLLARERAEATRGDPALGACYRSWPALALTSREVHALAMPMEVIVGANDRTVRRLYVDPLLRARPDVPVVYVPDAGHMTAPGKPRFIAALLDFLARR